MQLPTNTTLAAALTPGQKRNFLIKVYFDWQRNGLYADPNSDCSGNFVSAVIDRQLTGQFPAEMEIVEGYAGAEMDLVLEGAIGGVPVWKLFSPYAGYYEGTIGAVNTPVKLDVITMTPLGGIAVRQFTGYVGDGLPSRKDGNVTITCYEAPAQLTNPITLMAWAADSYTRGTLSATYPDAADSGTVALSWVVEDVLRRSGWLMGPPWHPNVTCAWTLNGSALPEVGTIGIEDPLVDGSWSYGYGEYNIPQFTPSGTPAQVYGPGKFGSTCFVGATKLPALSGRGISYLYGNAHAASSFVPTAYGSANSNLVGVGAWVQIDSTQSGSTQATVWLEEARYDFTSGVEYPAYLQFAVNHATGAVTGRVVAEGSGAPTWSWTSSSNVASGWHYVYAVFQFTSAAVNANIYSDGTLIASGNGGRAAALGTLTYGFNATNTNLCQVVARGPAQYVQVWYQANTALASATAPTWTQANPRAVIDRSLTRLTWLPNLQSQTAWSILQAAVQAELGAIYVDEQGVVHSDNRATVKGRQLIANSTATVTLDTAYEMSPETTFSSVVNTVPYTTQQKQAVSYSPIYETTQSGQFQPPANSNANYPVTTTGQSIRLGYVSWRPQAQGYAGGSGDGSAGPGGNFTWQDWMRIYSPDYWYDGFTAYPPGSTDATSQPTKGTGLDCVAKLGWATGDQDARHLTLNLINSNTSGGVMEYAVDDNTPFLHVGGTEIEDLGQTTATLADATSVGQYGQRSTPLPTSDFCQDPLTVPTVVASFLADTKQPQPSFKGVDVVGDPRRQLQDVHILSDPNGLGASMPVTVVGLNRKIDAGQNGILDSLTLRSF